MCNSVSNGCTASPYIEPLQLSTYKHIKYAGILQAVSIKSRSSPWLAVLHRAHHLNMAIAIDNQICSYYDGFIYSLSAEWRQLPKFSDSRYLTRIWNDIREPKRDSRTY